MHFDPDSLNDFLKENLEIHRSKSAKFIQKFQEFEQIEDEIRKLIPINRLERKLDNSLIDMDNHLLAAKQLKKFITKNTHLLM